MITIEDKLNRLKELTYNLENNSYTFEESMKIYNDGKKLVKEINEMLDNAELTIEYSDSEVEENNE